ncbi:MAG TPA: hypothetical protein VMD30_11120, partial [Tepidisphaeraceae bacterium]|nr:hypothetical protein [Tepidisphaeraceae bacterium]
TKYGGQVRQYADFLKSVPDTVKQINALASDLSQKFPDLSNANVSQDLAVVTQQIFSTLQLLPSQLQQISDKVNTALHERPPDYKGTADGVRDGLQDMSGLIDVIVKNFAILKQHGGLPQAMSQYIDQTTPEYLQLKKRVDDALKQASSLGELKLDTLRTALKDRNTILVMGTGDNSWRVIPYDQVWREPGQTATLTDQSTPQPRFAGEQAVTAAILGVSRSGVPQPKVCFVRSGGQPLLQPDFAGGNDLSEMAYRLGLYNYNVMEKDFSDTGQNPDAPPEPSDDDIKDALWVVWDFNPGQQSPDMPPPPSLAPELANHLREGGSAIVLTCYQQDPLTDAMESWGVKIHSDAMIVHEKIPAPQGESTDILNQALRLPFIFDLHDYGDQALTQPLAGLEGIFLQMCPITVDHVDGFTSWPLIPIPTSPDAPQSWGETNPDTNSAVLQNNATPTFNSKTDMAGPLYAGAAVENDTGARLVVLGGGPFMMTAYATLTAKRLDPNAPDVIRFPANGDLFTNAVFWASHQDSLIDISPEAMDVGRIRDISDGWLRFWRLGVLLIGMPGAVLIIGLAVYLRRMD